MMKVAKERDKLTLSFASEDLKKPMNELLNSWEERGYRLSTKGVTALIEMNHLSNSDHFSLVSSTYHYIYRNLKKVYGDNQEALYEAVNDILTKVVQIDTSQLMNEIQKKSEEGRQLLSPESSDINPLPKALTSTNEESTMKELGAPVLNTQQMIQSKREMDQIEEQRAKQQAEESRLQQEREALAEQQRAFEEMKRNMELQMQQMAQIQQMAQMQAFTFNQGQPMMQNQMYTPQQSAQPEPVEEVEEINQEQMAQSFQSLMNASPF